MWVSRPQACLHTGFEDRLGKQRQRGWVHEREDPLRIIKGKDTPVPGGEGFMTLECFCQLLSLEGHPVLLFTDHVSMLSVVLNPHLLLDI